jgi:tRNA-specific 2-thiouridylase
MRVLVAMSGGVDSAVAAALTVRSGDEAVGVTLQLADVSSRGLGASRCCSSEDVESAREVARVLGIPHYVLDFETTFRSRVLDPFVASYLAGETPLPCAHCNSAVKFGELLEVARTLGAAGVASGHYARVDEDDSGARVLRRGADREKDQSYFLFQLTREQLERVRFPLGGMRKADVRVIAAELGLPNAGRRDSQEVCFVPERATYVEVLERLALDRLPGDGEIVDAAGAVVGAHRGFHRYTVGQRRGIGLPSAARLYVTALDAAHNRVVVGDARETLRSRLEVRDVNWLSEPPDLPRTALVQVRSRHVAAPAEILATPGGGAEVRFAEPVASPAPGQAAVFYDGDRLLGGGWIERTS